MKKILIVTALLGFAATTLNAQAPATVSPSKDAGGQTVQPAPQPGPLTPVKTTIGNEAPGTRAVPATPAQPPVPQKISTDKEAPGTQVVQPKVVPPATEPATVTPSTRPAPKVAPASVTKGKAVKKRQANPGKKKGHVIKESNAPSKPISPKEDNKK